MIECETGLLGKVYACVMGGYSLDLIMPDEPVGSNMVYENRLSAPSSDGWGMRQDQGWGLHRGNFAVIHCLGIQVKSEILDDQVGELNDLIDAWVDRFSQWAEILSDGPTGLIVAQGASIEWVDLPFAKSLRQHIFTQAKPLSETCWSTAVDCANREEEPPLARSFLLWGEKAFAMLNWRAAVVDAATACEVALRYAIDEYMAKNNIPVGVRRALLRKSRNLGALKLLAGDLGIDLPGDLEEAVNKPRNRVLHGGDETCRDEAQAALSAARILVDKYKC
ncbi:MULTISPECIES: hypothetical protein [Amycolatopsis]|uniref:Apea-like HEPN domain-containing protein n=2 Tax=Amycolatopsis TaxID=1813 RepID=A0ABW5IC28_9PSEU